MDMVESIQLEQTPLGVLFMLEMVHLIIERVITMKKHALSLILAVSLSISMLAGCGSSSEANNNTGNDNQEKEIVDDVEDETLDADQNENDYSETDIAEDNNVPEPSNTDESVSTNNGSGNNLGTCVFEGPGSFSEGYCWIEFYDTDSIDPHRGIYGCIDKTGKMVFYLENTQCPSNFSDKGISRFHAFVQYGGGYYSITTDGKVELIHEGTDTFSCLISEDYECYLEPVSGFDKNQRKYYIYDPSGQLVKEITFEENEFPESVNYMGNGIFMFTYGMGSIGHLYFTKSDAYEKQYISPNLTRQRYKVGGDYLLYYVGRMNGEERANLTITDDKGNWKDVFIPSEYGNDPIYVDSSDNFILLSNGNEFYYLYDVKNDTFRKFDGQYSDRLDWYMYNLDRADCGNQVLALCLKGQDGDTYVGLYDINTFELVCEPILGGSPDIVNDNLVVQNRNEGTIIYSMKGEKIINLPDSYSVSYNDGVYRCDRGLGRTAYYYDENWNLLFTSDDINYSTAKQINY